MSDAERVQKEAGEPTTWDAAFREGRAEGLGEALGIPYREAWLRAGRPAPNDRRADLLQDFERADWLLEEHQRACTEYGCPDCISLSAHRYRTERELALLESGTRPGIPAEAFYPPPGYTGPRVQDYPGWKCGDCGCDNHAGEAFCFRCGACQPDDEDGAEEQA